MKLLSQRYFFILGIILIVALSFFLRLIFLDRVPTGISNDELDNVLNAKAVFLTGHDLTGNWNPWSLNPIASYYEQSELSAAVISPIVGPLPLSLFNARLPYAIFSTISVVCLFFITRKLFNQKAAFVTGLLAATNPWFIFTGRSNFDGAIANMFLLGALLLTLYAKRWIILLVFIPLFFAFYTYIGAKLVVLPFAVITSFFAWRYISQKKRGAYYIALLGLVIFLLYLPMLILNANRTGEILSPMHSLVEQRVDYERREAIVTPLQPIFSNKLFTFGRIFAEKYLGAFSPGYLFLYGDPKFLFSVFDHGVFYLYEMLFLLIGACVFYRSQKTRFLFLLAIIAITPLPSAFSTVGSSYTIRSFLLHPILLIFIAAGIIAAVESIKMLNLQKMVVAGMILLYIVSITNFMYIYILRNPIHNSESFNFSSRLLSNYVKREAKINNSNIFVLTGSPQIAYRHFVFYANLYNKNFIDEVKKAYSTNKFSYKNIHFISCKEILKFKGDEVLVFDPGQKCIKKDAQPQNISITQLSDGGEIYRVANGNICSGVELNRFPQNVKFDDFFVEKLQDEKFCQKFISSR